MQNSEVSPGPKKKLARTFQIFFLAAVGLPVLVLCRLAWDNYQQSLDLKTREELDQHLLILSGWHASYFHYKSYLRSLAENYFDRVNPKVPGASDPNLWFNRSKRFLEHLEKDNPPQKSRYLSAYTSYRTLYNRLIGRAISADPSQHDDFKSPIKVQIYVLEKSFSKNKHKSAMFYNDLFLDTPSRDGVDLENELERNEWLRNAGLMRVFDYLPVHMAINPRSSMMALIWDEFMGIVRDIMRGMVFGLDMALAEQAAFENLVKIPILESRKRWLLVRFFSKEMELYWKSLPDDFDYQAYRNSEAEAMDAICLAIMDMTDVRETFWKAFKSGEFPEGMQPVAGMDEEFLNQTASAVSIGNHLQKKGFLSLGLVRHLLKEKKMWFYALSLSSVQEGREGSVLSAFSPDGTLLEGTTLSEKAAVDFLQFGSSDFQVQKLMRVLNPQTGQYYLNRDAFRDYAISEIVARESEASEREALRQKMQSSTDGMLLANLLPVLRTSLQFTFIHPKDQKEWMGTMHPTEDFPNQAYLTLQSSEPLKAVLKRDAVNTVLFILAALMAVAGMGTLISKKVIRPILILNEGIRALAEGNYDKKVEILSDNELGKLGWHFNRMAANIEDKLFQMNLIRELNQMMNKGLPRNEIMQYLVHVIHQRYQNPSSLLSFVSGELSAMPQDYVFLGMESGLEFLAGFRQEILSTYVTDADRKSEKIRHAIALPDSIRLKYFPDSQRASLLFTREKLKDQDGVMTGLFLILDADADFTPSMVQSLFEQARSVFHKSLLEEIKADAEKGWEIQESLMPTQIPDTQGILDIGSSFVAARGLAGDYYDFLVWPDKIGFSIADVSGKGIGPSLFGATSRAIMRVVSQDSTSAGAHLTELNRGLCYKKTSSLFLTMFYCVIDLKTLNMEYASAGHNKMYLMRSNQNIEELSAKGLPCGLFDGGKYETKNIQLEPGDSLILYTDGVTELENQDLELYGMERFAVFCQKNHSLSASDFVKELEQELSDFRNGILLSDDVTFIIVKVEKQELKSASV